jgi:hypothetical protein
LASLSARLGAGPRNLKTISESVLTKHIRHIRLGDHLCLPFASDMEQREVVSAYIADGLTRGERVLYYSNRTAPDAIDAWLHPRGIDGALAIARGQLEVRHPSATVRNVLKIAGWETAPGLDIGQDEPPC